MTRQTLSLLTKPMLIELICSDKMWEYKAGIVVDRLVQNKINGLLDEEENLDLTDMEDFVKYKAYEKEIDKWFGIQEKLLNE